SAAVSNGDGRLTSPFNTLAAFNTLNTGVGDNPAAGDNVLLYSGSYTGPLPLLTTQKLIGQGASASITAISGLSLAPDSDALPTTGGTAPTLTNTSGNVINLAQNNTLRGIALGNRSGIAINGSSFGTLTVANDVSITGTGQALALATGTLAGDFASVSGSTATGSVGGLTSVAGPCTAGGGLIT